MKRYLDPIDMVVAIGMFATVVGGCFFFMAANGTLKAGAPQPLAFERSGGLIDPMEAMEWVQPALGQAIVENELLTRQASQETTQAVTELIRAMAAEESLNLVPYGYLEPITSHADGMDADQAARVQYVAGRSLVTSTARGVRAGVLSSSRLDGAFNNVIIAMAQATMNGMEDSYRDTRDPMLGWAIVEAAQRHMRSADQLQHRLGMAITRVVEVQNRFNETIGSAQGQLGAVAVASLHTEQLAGRFDQLAKADFAQPPAAVFSSQRGWPDIPISVLIGMSAILFGLFVMGLILPGTKPEPMPEVEAKPLPYRKTA
jgi:hypothetical protein